MLNIIRKILFLSCFNDKDMEKNRIEVELIQSYSNSQRFFVSRIFIYLPWLTKYFGALTELPIYELNI